MLLSLFFTLRSFVFLFPLLSSLLICSLARCSFLSSLLLNLTFSSFLFLFRCTFSSTRRAGPFGRFELLGLCCCCCSFLTPSFNLSNSPLETNLLSLCCFCRAAAAPNSPAPPVPETICSLLLFTIRLDHHTAQYPSFNTSSFKDLKIASHHSLACAAQANSENRSIVALKRQRRA